MPFFIRKANADSKEKKRKVRSIVVRVFSSFVFNQKLQQTQNAKKKTKTSSELTNGHTHNKKSKKEKPIIDDNEEIPSDSDLDDDDDQGQKNNGNVRLDDLLLNREDHDDEEEDINEQRLKRAKEYIEQIAKQGKTEEFVQKFQGDLFECLEQEREVDRDVVSDRLRDDVVRMMEEFDF